MCRAMRRMPAWRRRGWRSRRPQRATARAYGSPARDIRARCRRAPPELHGARTCRRTPRRGSASRPIARRRACCSRRCRCCSARASGRGKEEPGAARRAARHRRASRGPTGRWSGSMPPASASSMPCCRWPTRCARRARPALPVHDRHGHLGAQIAAAAACAAATSTSTCRSTRREFVARFLDHWRPDIAVLDRKRDLAEHDHGSAPTARFRWRSSMRRMSHRSFERWSSEPAVARPLFSRFDLVLAQNEELAQRFPATRRAAGAGGRQPQDRCAAAAGRRGGAGATARGARRPRRSMSPPARTRARSRSSPPRTA